MRCSWRRVIEKFHLLRLWLSMLRKFILKYLYVVFFCITCNVHPISNCACSFFNLYIFDCQCIYIVQVSEVYLSFYFSSIFNHVSSLTRYLYSFWSGKRGPITSEFTSSNVAMMPFQWLVICSVGARLCS